MAEGGGLLNRYTAQKLYRGFESPSLRQIDSVRALIGGLQTCEAGGPNKQYGESPLSAIFEILQFEIMGLGRVFGLLGVKVEQFVEQTYYPMGSALSI